MAGQAPRALKMAVAPAAPSASLIQLANLPPGHPQSAFHDNLIHLIINANTRLTAQPNSALLVLLLPGPRAVLPEHCPHPNNLPLHRHSVRFELGSVVLCQPDLLKLGCVRLR